MTSGVAASGSLQSFESHFILDDMDGDRLVAGLTHEAFYVDSHVFDRDGLLTLAAELTKLAGPAREVRITPQETVVLRHLAAGLSNKEIARRLALSVRTVETHRLNLRRKTQSGRLHDLVTLARDLGLEPL